MPHLTSVIKFPNKPGRPPFDVDTDTEQILYLREVGFTLSDIARILGVTLYRRRKETGILEINR